MKRLLFLGLLAAAHLAQPVATVAQELADPVLNGRVFLGDSAARSGVVVVHRVSTDSQGEVDSVRVRSDGTFSVRLP